MKIAGIILFVFGVLVTGLLIIGMFASDNTKAGDLAETISIIFFVGNVPLIAGALMIRIARIKERQQRTDQTERTLLRMAHKYGGRLTATIVAMETELSLDEARTLLGLFVTKGAADTEIDDDGTIVYRFRELAIK
jgi:hypothetical protein